MKSVIEVLRDDITITISLFIEVLSFHLGMALRVCKQSEVTLIQGTAQFVSSGVIEVNGEQFSANHILIATGGAPLAPNLPGTNCFLSINLLVNLCCLKCANLFVYLEV